MTRSTESGLSARDREILKDVIRTFIATGEPVSSRSMAKLRHLGLSAASIRNVMADLEDLGFLAQPHTSAGRVPTGDGYHLYIESLMGEGRLPVRERRYIDSSLGDSHDSADALMTSASHLLSELSQQIGIVVTPAIGETTLKNITFVPLSGCKVLCVLVSTSGFVDNKVIETPEELPRTELIRISNYLSENFSGQTLREIRDSLLGHLAEERARVDRLLANAISLARQAFEAGDGPEVLVEGTAAVLAHPELADVDRVKRLLDTFADRMGLVRLLNQLIEGGGARVAIKDDSDVTSRLDFSLVAAPYRIGERSSGTLGIFGPSRMDYRKVVPLVNYFGKKLSEALEDVYIAEYDA